MKEGDDRRIKHQASLQASCSGVCVCAVPRHKSGYMLYCVLSCLVVILCGVLLFVILCVVLLFVILCLVLLFVTLCVVLLFVILCLVLPFVTLRVVLHFVTLCVVLPFVIPCVVRLPLLQYCRSLFVIVCVPFVI